MRFCALWIAAAPLLTTIAPAAHAQGNRAATATPQLDYQMDGYRDERLTYDSAPEGYQGRSNGIEPGQPPQAQSMAAAAAPPPAAGAATVPPPAPSPATKPDPAYIGSGMVVNGWYYPPPQVTTVVTEYAPVR